MKPSWKSLLVAQLGLSIVAGTTYAQSTPPQGDQPVGTTAPNGDPAVGLDAVTVTASKKTQYLLDVPYAVTPISGQEIRDRNVRDIRDLQGAVPSLYVTSNSPGMTRIQLRGISTAQGLPTVGVYFDEVPLDQGFAQRTIDIPLVDLQRLEVLRGPQGTLYGAGSLGGTIRYITAAPQLDGNHFTTEGGVNHVAGAKSQGYFADAIANLALSPGTAALRVVVGTEDIPGWIDNRTNGQTDINDTRRQYVRVKGLVRLSDSVDATLTLYNAQLKADAVSLSNAQRVVSQAVPTPVNDRTGIANLVVNADLGPLVLVSSTSYLFRGLDSTADVSALIPVPGGVGYRQDESSRSISQELRVNSNFNGPFSFTSGLYYRHLDSFVTTTIAQINSRSQATQPANSRQYAVFGEATYAFLRNVSGTLGLRYFEDHQTAERFSAPAASASQTFHAVSPRLDLLWRYDQSGSVYANIAKGFRSGGFNAFTDVPLTYGPERLWTYEVGNKQVLFDGLFSYDAAAYYNKYSDIQGYLISNVPLPHLIIQNTGRASGMGYDLALSTKITKQLAWDVTFGYNNVTYDITNLDRLKGDPLNYVPKRTVGTSLNYRYQWAPGVPGLARIDYQYASPTKLIFRNMTPQVSTTDAIKTLNFRIGVEMKNWQAYLEGRNLTNNYPVISPKIGAQAEDARSIPRSIGVSARAEF